MSLMFGRDRLCRYCKGAGGSCSVCDGTGLHTERPTAVSPLRDRLADALGGRPHSTPDPNSQEAADVLEPHAPTVRWRVLGHLIETGGATCEQVEEALELSHQTASARLTELFERDVTLRPYRVLNAAGRKVWFHVAQPWAVDSYPSGHSAR